MAATPRTAEVYELEDGRTLAIRPIRPEDAERLIDLFNRLSPETVRRRFFVARKRLDLREAQRYAGVDHNKDEALVAIAPSPSEDIVAVARYASTASGQAELALVVEDAYQNCGLGSQLLHDLVELARARGVTTIYANVLPDNEPMLHLLRASGYPVRVSWSEGARRVALNLTLPVLK